MPEIADHYCAPILETGTFESEEPVLFEAAIKPWNLTVDLRHSTKFSCRVQYLRLAGITLYRDTYGHGMRLQGMTPRGTLTLSLPVRGLTDESAFWNEPLDDQSIYSTFHREIDSVTSEKHDQFIILLDAGGCGEPEFAELLNLFDGAPARLSVMTERRERLLRFCRRLMRLAQDPAVAGDGKAICLLRDEFIDVLKRTLDVSPGRALLGGKEAGTLSAMFEILAGENYRVPSVKELCRTMEVSERTLERAVRARFDCTVQALLRRFRLHEARRHLLAIDRQRGSVTEIAFNLGFFDPGRFAGEYRRTFGELPSQTLKQTAQGQPPETLLDVLIREKR
ncbi:AraC family transcriptional regulator [Roseibium aggregatum]|uniref:AraC family transcriptional regulator n=1 Tax=Roseibium aggregatum TaxID=187304 RepID=A0A939J3Y3_9HYPH|nr:helix-turn-helix domain-containing protein [Roseibium aggregatum]MBN9672988.1 AraC family transcriptional regulator [Roseibium aggregatum]